MTPPLDNSDNAQTWSSFIPLKRNITARRRRSLSAATGSRFVSSQFSQQALSIPFDAAPHCAKSRPPCSNEFRSS